MLRKVPMKKIDTLIPDIYAGLEKGWRVDDERIQQSCVVAGVEMGEGLIRQVQREERKRPPFTLYASEIGKRCHRQIWFGVHHPEWGEPLRGATRMKFMYGDAIESQVLSLAEMAGHKVEKRQHPLNLTIMGWEVRGKIDAVIDDVLVDVKSATRYSFNKFSKDGLREVDDAFGYRMQLWFYEAAMSRDESAWLVVDKQLGNMMLSHNKTDRLDYSHLEAVINSMGAEMGADVPGVEKENQKEPNGNVKLGVTCSYCPYKDTCYPEMRTFLYSTGPVFYAKVVKEPKVPELKKE